MAAQEKLRETDLYPPVKALLEAQGYEVKGEIRGVDVVGVRDGETVVVELKTAFGLPLILQAVDRLAVADAVYVAAPPSGALKRNRRESLKLCRMLGLGLLSVSFASKPEGAVEILLDPGPYAPRTNARRRGRLLKEFERRSGDPEPGGSAPRPSMTAYRQDALRCARHLAQSPKGRSRPAEIKAAAGVERAGPILSSDHYGWFERIDRGVYRLTDKGRRALEIYADQLPRL